jgi:hypothetical protein
MAFKMKGFSGFGNSPAKQKKIKNKGHMEGPIPEQNINLQPGESDGTWIYGRGYKGGDPKEGLAEMKATEKRLNENKNIKPNSGTDFVKRERIIDYDDRAEVLQNNDLWDVEDDLKTDPKNKKLLAKQKKLKETIKTLDREAQIMRDRTDK